MLLFLYFSLLFTAITRAQTPVGFSPNVTAHLDVIFSSVAVTPPGMNLTKAAVAKQPTIGTSDEALNGTYLFVMLDIDVPASFTGGAAGTRGVNLHAMLTGFKSSGQTMSGTYILSSVATSPASYLAPAPPAEAPPHPHKYVELLFEQPANWAVPSSQQSAVSNRLGFNLTQFTVAAGLGSPIRANYFQVAG
ncbi:PEBP-like protein [Glonium stellatum]|uniref:PEBP-like protein n=1 Tax=Glonium stellatum TaxID=574774 RepID=A0A8E2EQD1_9PEZI|nr:PEBP-like protein [Glonium stellatum]